MISGSAGVTTTIPANFGSAGVCTTIPAAASHVGHVAHVGHVGHVGAPVSLAVAASRGEVSSAALLANGRVVEERPISREELAMNGKLVESNERTSAGVGVGHVTTHRAPGPVITTGAPVGGMHMTGISASPRPAVAVASMPAAATRVMTTQMAASPLGMGTYAVGGTSLTTMAAPDMGRGYVTTAAAPPIGFSNQARVLGGGIANIH